MFLVLKNKLKLLLIAILTISITLCCFNISNAENETSDYEIRTDSEMVDGSTTSNNDSESDIMPISSNDPTPIITTDEVQENINEEESVDNESDEDEQNNNDENDTIKESDVYLFDTDVNIDYAIDGNAYIMADNVTISSEIGGDVFVIAKNVNIESNAEIYSNLFVLSENLNIDGAVYDVYALSSTITINSNGYIYRDIHASTSDMNILGSIGRNAFLDCKNISFDSEHPGIIYGDLNYSSQNEFSGFEDYVNGNINYNAKITSSEPKSINILSYIQSLITYLIFVLFIALILKWKAPTFSQKSSTLLTKKAGSIIGFGFLTLFALPIIIFILILLNITSSIALLLLTLYCILIAIASSIVAIALGNFVKIKMNLSNKYMDIIMPVIIGLIIWILKLIPYVSELITLVTLIIGLGILATLFISKEQKQTVSNQEN